MVYKYTDRVSTREEAYFHISNSGFTFKLIEKEVQADKGDGKELDGPSVTWEAEVRLGAFGHGVSFRFPVVANMAEYFENVFGRLHRRMRELTESGNYDGVNGYERHSSVNNAKVAVVDGMRLEEVLEKEGYKNVSRWATSSSSNFASAARVDGKDASPNSNIEYHLDDEVAGEGSELEALYNARMDRLDELKAPLGKVRALGGGFRPSQLLDKPLKVKIVDSVRELTWDDSWASGPERGEKAKEKIGDFFEKYPHSFWLYTSGFPMSKRKLVIERLGITDPNLVSALLRGNG